MVQEDERTIRVVVNTSLYEKSTRSRDVRRTPGASAATDADIPGIYTTVRGRGPEVRPGGRDLSTAGSDPEFEKAGLFRRKDCEADGTIDLINQRSNGGVFSVG